MKNKLSANDIDYIEKFAESYGMEYSGYSTINDFATYISVEDNTTKDYGIFIADIRFAVGTKVDKQILIKYFSDIKIDSDYVCLENYIKKNELKPIKNKEVMLKLGDVKTENLLNLLPENFLIFKDSGVWKISEDSIREDIINYWQVSNESIKDFIIRVIKDLENNQNFKQTIIYNYNDYVSNVVQTEKKQSEISLKITYENAINSYIKEFEKVHEIEFEWWVGDCVGEIAQFGDYYFDFSEIKLSIDEKIDFETISEWYWYCVDNPKNLYNLKTFAKLKSDFWSARKFLKVEFTKQEKKLMFENYLLKLSLRSYEKVL